MLDDVRLPLAVSLGDPAGIGLDVLCLAWLQREERGLPPFAVIGCRSAIEARARTLGIGVPVEAIERWQHAPCVFAAALPVIDTPLPGPVAAGVPSPANARTVIASIERAVDAVRRGDAAAVVTCPIAKSELYATGFAHPGHTEFLAALAAKQWPGSHPQPVMMIASEALRVVPLTIHIALAEVPGAISAAAINATVRVMASALTRDFGIAAPRIAVTGLNPHAGEDGAMGREEIETIAPAIRALRQAGFDVSGPHPADTLFHAARRATYDAVLAMYHDQALIPAKTLAFDTGVNVTLGLPFVRTSPDHGTAFDVAGTGRASPESFIAALVMASEMARRRALAPSGATA
ncbi:MAG: 4-hydroxythreonine-4-phosphate dehydrogenase PdxA [Hyphomicrobiaceae bacterium]